MTHLAALKTGEMLLLIRTGGKSKRMEPGAAPSAPHLE
jgi:hypothetical protein